MTNNLLPAVEPANPTASWTAAQWDEFHDRLERLQGACGPKSNKNDHARVLITACINEGVNTVGQIIKALVPLGFNARHLGAMLTKGKGGWIRRDAQGVLSLAAD